MHGHFRTESKNHKLKHIKRMKNNFHNPNFVQAFFLKKKWISSIFKASLTFKSYDNHICLANLCEQNEQTE